MPASNSVPDISVIVPVYGVEPFAERCARALMEQTLADGVEFLFVDDASPDRSMEIIRQVIEEYPKRQKQVKILTLSQNRGLPAARNTGLDAARGQYIVHVDSDDNLEPQMLAEMLAAARRTGADYVWSDWFLTFADNQRAMAEPDAASPDEALRLQLSGRMKYNVWNKMLARRLYDETGIRFPEGYGMGEDMTMIMLLCKARRVAHVGQPLYHYLRTNPGAFTADSAKRAASLNSLKHNADRVIEYLSVNGVAPELIDRFKLSAKWPLLVSDSPEDFATWRRWWPEANGAISRCCMSLRSRLLQQTAARGWRWPSLLYNKLIKTLYGKIYR